uniref:Myosin motor domain-containing protein n=1 Tax=Amorphochlora amoebiformis TaxID=1561963 RepID=A0A7S0CZB3_9EUKA|mmetsp:Transcript_15194/g.24044  ORF Transcript_15194/g.24044 Transcript_15194/m.24044 type:complete len:1402 (+) Transcript_15194:2-4207(+)
MEEAEIKDQGRIQLISDLLHVDRKEIEKSLLFRVISVGNERHATPVPIDEVKTVRDATAKYIYGKLFLFLVDHLNSRFGQAGEYRSIGVLDIFGFEVFEKNTFEQFCINYANEKLQYLFNQHVFLGELKEYKSQGIDISGVTFTNNKGCLDLIEKKQGIIAMMGEEAALPRGDAKGLINKMHRKFKTNKFYKHIMRAPMSFVVAHYAGKVRYEIKDFLQKDNDFLSADIITALEATTNETVEAMLREFRARSSVGEDTRSSTLKKKNIRHSSSSFLSKRLMTVSAQFRTHLTALMQKLQTAEPHYVRCLKPNGSKLPNVYDSRIVLRQITYAGLLQAIKLRRMGFPYRQTHKEFVRQYQICTQRRRANTTRSRSLERLRPPKTIENLFRDRARTQSPPVGKQRKHLHRRGRSAAHLNLERLKIEKLERYIKNKQKESTPKTQTIKDQLEKLIQTMWPHLYAIDSSLTEADYRIGKTKIFLKSSLRNALGTHWKACMKSRVVQIQSLYRMWSTRRRYKQLLKVYRRGQFAAQARDLNALEAVFPVIEEFELEEINPAFVAKLIDLKAFLEAETHVLNLIKEACKSRDIEQLKAAKISAQGLTQEYPTESQSEALVKAKGRASTIIAELEKVNKIKELLKTAMLHESIKELELATQLAEEKGGELEFKSLAEALKLLDRLKKEQAVIADFESVYSVMEAKKKMDLKDIEKLELVSDKLRLISGDSKCTARVSAADRLMRNALGSLMEKAEAIDDANFMEEMLIPKAGAMGFAKLETNGMDWLQKKRQAEAKRKEQLEKDEAKRKEEARKEEESKAEAAKVAEATKPEPEPKTPVKENLKTQKAQESSKTNQEVQKFSVGAIVMVTGLSSNVQYNERVGQVQGYASANKRYVVMLGNNERLGVREKNLKVADATTEHVFARKQEMTSEKNKVTEKAKEDIGRDGVQLRADLCEELRKAAEDRDEKQLIRLLDLPEVQEAETHKDVRMAQDTLQLIRDAAEASEKLEKAIEDVKTTQIKAWLHKISEMGLEDKQKHTNPVDRKKLKELVDRGRHIAYLMTKQELLVLKLRKALKDLNKTKLKFLLRFATTSWLRAQPEVFQAESFLSSNPEMTTSQVMTPPKIDLDQSLSSRRSGSPPSNGSRKRRDNQTKRSSLNGQLREALRQYQKIRGLHPLGSLLRVRTESQWLKKIFFSRKYLKRHRLIHQSQPLPHSVTTLKTSSHDVKQRAKSMFRNILFYAQESYHAYPVTLGYKVIHEAVGEPQLRPEIYCQLIKQCTNIKSQMSLIRYWKLLFMCLNAFEPEGEVKLCILSFAAKYANFDVKLNDPVIRNKLRVLDKVETLATLMLILQFQRPISGRTPTMEEVRKVTDMHMLPESLEPPVMQVYRDKLDLKSTVSTTPTSTIKL